MSCTTMRKAAKDALASSFSSGDVKKIEANIYAMCEKIVAADASKESTLESVYGKYAYEKVGELLSKPKLKNKIIKDIGTCVVEWNSSVYAKFRENERKDTSDQISGMKVSKGEFKCRNKSCIVRDECYYYTMQTSSCDESMTTYVVCSKCGERYTMR